MHPFDHKSAKSTFALLLHELRLQGTMKMILEGFCVVSASIFKLGLLFHKQNVLPKHPKFKLLYPLMSLLLLISSCEG
jgi:hypothetical protein